MSVLLTLLATALAADPAEADAEAQYGICVHCHGAHGEGRPELGAPRIGDLEADFIAAQLAAFRDGGHGAHPDDESGRIMRAVSIGLRDDAIETLAAFSAALEPTPRAPGTPVDGGRTAYASCATCHGADARGVEGTGAPDLLYQDSDYLAAQLKKYRDGQRGGAGAPPMATVMAGLSQGLDDEAIDRVVAHIASLRPALPPLASPAVTRPAQDGLDAFADIYAAATHPRCMNCHPAGDAPLQTDDSVPHSMNITRFSPNTGTHCSTCHPAAIVDGGQAPMPPADPIWSLAPREMVFQDRTPAQLCAQLKDPARNGGRGLTSLTAHVADDHLLITSWHSGRTPPPISHAELVERFQIWSEAGGPCPE